jgi:hypothetical protein
MSDIDLADFEERIRMGDTLPPFMPKWPKLDWRFMHELPVDTRRALLKCLILSGKVPILGGIGGFDWPDLYRIGMARKSVDPDRHGDIHSIAYCYTGPGYINDRGQFVRAGEWRDEAS